LQIGPAALATGPAVRVPAHGPAAVNSLAAADGRAEVNLRADDPAGASSRAAGIRRPDSCRTFSTLVAQAVVVGSADGRAVDRIWAAAGQQASSCMIIRADFNPARGQVWVIWR
jgi:hypothetical protein